MRTIHGLLIGLTVLIGACSGGTTNPSAAPASPASTVSAAPPSAAASPVPASSPATGTVDLPAACAEAIRAYVIAIEPIVKDVQWQTMTDMPPEVEAQLGSVTTTIDPEVCPDMSVTEARDAWTAIAFDVAPGTLDYIDFVYRP